MLPLIAVDTGGTFTDVILVRSDGAWRTHKLLSTPDDPARAVLLGVQAILDAEGAPRARRVVHGSTVATNALLEGKGGDAAFITTAGFEDTLAIARQHRPDLYALHVVSHPPPIPARRTLGVRERVAFDGQILAPLHPDDLRELPGRVEALGVQAVAISLLHSYANPAHERALAARLRAALPGLHITASVDLLPELREYERGVTCAVNAVVAPRMDAYLQRLADGVGEDALRVMGSSGGLLRVQDARAFPAHTVLSGPAGGVVGALALARGAGLDQIVTFDMGGTSTDVALCDGGLSLTTEGGVGHLPVRLPLLDIHTVGAGGGSLAWVDGGGALRVGPASAGADPGPACYGRQPADQPLRATVTDAHVVLGHLRPEAFLGGGMALDRDAALRALQGLADAAGLPLLDAARGVLRVVEAAMTRAVKVISVERGYDVRRFALVAFGGAGALHACALADALGMAAVFVPPHPGLLSAVGMALAPPVFTASRAVMLRLPPGAPLQGAPLEDALQALTAQARAALDAEGVPDDARRVTRAVDLRFAGQSFELSVDADGPDPIAAFRQRHRDLYGTDHPDRPVEVVAARVRAEGPPGASPPPFDAPDAPTPARLVEVYGPEGPQIWACLPRAVLAAGERRPGPLLLTEYSSTVLVPPGWAVEVHAQGGLLLRRTAPVQP